MKRILILLLCAVLTAGLFAGCTTEGSSYVPTGDALEGFSPPTIPTETDDSQNLSLGYFPNSSLNPYSCTNLSNRVIVPLIYQSLFAVDENYQAWPLLCWRYVASDDLRVHKFYLAEATFSDGTLLEPMDVVASLLKAKESEWYSGRFTYIESIMISVDGAVQIVTTTPYGELPLLLDIPIVKSSEVDLENPLGTGAYVMEETVSGLRLRRRNFWWCRADDWQVTATYIPLIPVESTDELRDQFEYGNVSVMCADPGSPTYAEVRCDYELWDMESGILVYMVCNKDWDIFSNDQVRAAMTHCVDRYALVDKYYGGFASVAMLPASPQSPFYSKQLAASYGFNKQLVAAAVASAKLESKELTMLLNNQDPERMSVGREIAAILEECGFTVTRNELDIQSYNIHLDWTSFDVYIGQTRLSPNMDLSQFFAPEGTLSVGNLESVPRYSMSLEALANSGNFYNLHKLVMQDGCLVPILFRNYAVYAQRGLFTDLYPARDNLFFYHIDRTMEEATAPLPTPEENA